MSRAMMMLKCEFKHGEFPHEACPAVDVRRVTALREAVMMMMMMIIRLMQNRRVARHTRTRSAHHPAFQFLLIATNYTHFSLN